MKVEITYPWSYVGKNVYIIEKTEKKMNWDGGKKHFRKNVFFFRPNSSFSSNKSYNQYPEKFCLFLQSFLRNLYQFRYFLFARIVW